MRIHSDKLNALTLRQCIGRAGLDDVQLWCCQPHGSRKRSRAFEVALIGTGARHRRNAAHAEAQGCKAATYDDWGHWLAQIFAVDCNALCGPYHGHDDFDKQTRYAFDANPDAQPFGVIGSVTYDAPTDTLAAR